MAISCPARPRPHMVSSVYQRESIIYSALLELLIYLSMFLFAPYVGDQEVPSRSRGFVVVPAGLGQSLILYRHDSLPQFMYECYICWRKPNIIILICHNSSYERASRERARNATPTSQLHDGECRRDLSKTHPQPDSHAANPRERLVNRVNNSISQPK